MSNVTIKDVAKQANVSIATVSRVLNKNYFVSPELEKKVMDAIKELDYYPNSVARSLKNESTQTIGLIVSDISNSFFTFVNRSVENVLKKYNYNVVHNMDYHDYPSYNGSYTNSLKTVENILKTTSSDIIIDLHRDAIGSRSDYAPIVKIGENDIAAQLMFVIGTNQGGLWHPNWNQNLKFAIKIQEKAEEMYPRII